MSATLFLVIFYSTLECGEFWWCKLYVKNEESINSSLVFLIIMYALFVFQATVPRILEQTEEVYFKRTNYLLKESSDICCDRINEIPCITCAHRLEGSMVVMVKKSAQKWRSKWKICKQQIVSYWTFWNVMNIIIQYKSSR